MDHLDIEMNDFSYEPILLAKNSDYSFPRAPSAISSSLNFLRSIPRGKLKYVLEDMRSGEYDGDQNLTIQDRRKDRTLILTAHELSKCLQIIELEEEQKMEDIDGYSVISPDDNLSEQNSTIPCTNVESVS